MDPAKQAFREHWKRIRDCRVVFGRFTAREPVCEALFDNRASAGPTLYVVADGTNCGNANRRGVDLVGSLGGSLDLGIATRSRRLLEY